jgi:branched-chain amino acid transport system substrate-binding protein
MPPFFRRNYIASSLFEPHDDVLRFDPRVEQAQHRFYSVLDEAKVPVDIVAAHAWDPGMMIVGALRKLGPSATAEQVRDSLSSLSDWPGVNGVYDFTKVPQRGLDVHSAVITRWDAAVRRWVIANEAGGAPIVK